MGDEGATYRDAGVDRDRAAEAIQGFRRIAESTPRRGVIDLPDGFAGLFDLGEVAGKEVTDPVLFAAADGVGTKPLLVRQPDEWEAIGSDLVAMCANDLIVHGARPLFFLDYVATGRIRKEILNPLAVGIGLGCKEAEMALLGGETAEMPDAHDDEVLDLAGFAVGVADRSRIIRGEAVEVGDLVLGLRSAGLHANGFSLVRKVLDDSGTDLDEAPSALGGRTLAEALLEPTRIYGGAIRFLLRCFEPNQEVRAMAHVTGGGLPANLRRVLPGNRRAVIRRGSWEVPPIFRVIQEIGGIEQQEMERVFNLGLGYVVVVPEHRLDAVARILAYVQGEVRVVGEIESGGGEVVFEGERQGR